MKVKIRKMGIQDIFKISKLKVDTPYFDYPLLSGTKYPKWKTVFERIFLFLSLTPLRYFSLRYYVCFLAFVNKKVAGILFLTFSKFSAKECTLGIFVSKRHRGRGIGKMLIKKAIEWAKENNVRKIILSVYEDNKIALNLYKKMGFKTIKRMLYMEMKLK